MASCPTARTDGMGQHRTMSYRKIWWTDFSAAEFQDLDPMKTIAVFPVAAVEQHGPHLPVGTDTIINQGHLDLLVERAPKDMDIRILPVQAIGKSNEHIWQTGTITHLATNAIEAWTQIGLEIARSGIRKVVFVNSHGGNVSILDIVARELRVKAGMLAVKTGWSQYWPKDIYSDIENRHGIHGGRAEILDLTAGGRALLAFDPTLALETALGELREADQDALGRGLETVLRQLSPASK